MVFSQMKITLVFVLIEYIDKTMSGVFSLNLLKKSSFTNIKIQKVLVLWKESMNSDGKQFHQYQYIEHKTTTFDIGNTWDRQNNSVLVFEICCERNVNWNLCFLE